jgi:aminoglycoside phosphotransferase (APT) family kinase protein
MPDTLLPDTLLPDTLIPALSAWLSGQQGRQVAVDAVSIASTGARRVNALFDVRCDGTSTRLALTMIPSAAIQLLDIRAEADVRLLAESAGVPVPHVWHVCTDDGVLGGPFFISTAVDGETVPRRVLRLAREHRLGERIVDQLGEAMARLHLIDPAPAPATVPRPVAGGPIATGLSIVDTQIGLLTAPSPVFAYAARWLERNAPPEPDRSAIVHSDIRNGNIIVGDDGLRAILDWETTHVGDPMEDLAWPCQRMWRFREDARTVGGFAGVDLLRAAYVRGGGTWDQQRFDWWRVHGTVKWGLGLASQARAHIDGSFRSIVTAASGRRVAELEYDTLLLLRPAR